MADSVTDSELTPAEGLRLAVRVAGSQSALGRLVGRNQSTIHDWLREEKPLPAEYVLKVEAALGIARGKLRSDLYPVEITSATGAAPLAISRGASDRRSGLQLGAPAR